MKRKQRDDVAPAPVDPSTYFVTSGYAHPNVVDATHGPAGVTLSLLIDGRGEPIASLKVAYKHTCENHYIRLHLINLDSTVRKHADIFHLRHVIDPTAPHGVYIPHAVVIEDITGHASWNQHVTLEGIMPCLYVTNEQARITPPPTVTSLAFTSPGIAGLSTTPYVAPGSELTCELRLSDGAQGIERIDVNLASPSSRATRTINLSVVEDLPTIFQGSLTCAYGDELGSWRVTDVVLHDWSGPAATLKQTSGDEGTWEHTTTPAPPMAPPAPHQARHAAPTETPYAPPSGDERIINLAAPSLTTNSENASNTRVFPESDAERAAQYSHLQQL